MTIVLVGKGLVLGGWPSKIDVFGAPDTSTHRLPFRWEDFVCLFFVEKQKVLNLNWVCRVHVPFFYITLTGVSNDIFHPHVFFWCWRGTYIYMKYCIFLYIYLYMYIYIFILKTLFERWLAKGNNPPVFPEKKQQKSVPPSPQKKSYFVHCPRSSCRNSVPRRAKPNIRWATSREVVGMGKMVRNWCDSTVDGWHPAPVEMVNIPVFTWFYTSQVVRDFWTINSRSPSKYERIVGSISKRQIFRVQGILVSGCFSYVGCDVHVRMYGDLWTFMGFRQ